MSVERLPFVCPACRATVPAPAALDGVEQACPKCRAVVTWHAPEPPRRGPPPLPAARPAAPEPELEPIPDEDGGDNRDRAHKGRQGTLAGWRFHWREPVGMLLIGAAGLMWYNALSGPGPLPIKSTVLLTAFTCGMIVWGGVLIAQERTDELSRKVTSLNPIRGKTLEKVVRRLGPARESVIENGVEVATWGSPGYSITLAFRDGVCTGVVREVVTEI